MKNIESTPPSLSTPLASISVCPELAAIEPWSTPNPKVRVYFEKSRPDAWPILPPRDQLNPQAREALAVFDKADELRAEPGYEEVLELAGLRVEVDIKDSKKQAAEKLIDKGIRLGKIPPEDRESKLARYTERSGWVKYGIERQVLSGELPGDSFLCKPLQLGSSALERLAILEALGFNEGNIKGSIVFGSKHRYDRKVQESDRFFRSTEKEQREQLKCLLDDAKTNQANEEKRKKEAARVAGIERMSGGDVERVVEWFKSCAESLRQDGYVLSSMVNLESSREKAELVKGSIAELRQYFPDLRYPSGLSVLDYLSETYGADSTAAVLVGAQVVGTGKVYTLGLDWATVYRKLDSSDSRSY